MTEHCTKRCPDECETHRRFRCDTCARMVSWAEGADDDMPGACADCWFKAHLANRALASTEGAR